MNDNERKKFCEAAAKEVGYMEKMTNNYKYYENKTANAGRGNYTRYGRIADVMLSGKDRRNKDGYSWCAMFLLATLYESKGGKVDTSVDAGKLLLDASVVSWCKVQLYSAASYGWQYYAGVDVWLKGFTKVGKVSNVPHYGDIVVFLKNKLPYHIGIVISVADNYVTTVEGNTSASGTGDEVVANGGCVAIKKRKINSGLTFLQL